MTKRLLAATVLITLMFSCSKYLDRSPQTVRASLVGKKVVVYMTAAESSYRLSKIGNETFTESVQPLETEVGVFVNPEKKFQTMLGIGGAITDASAEVFAQLPENRQQELLDAYYDPHKGIGYTLARTNIHSCDFSSSSYTYIEDGDKELKTFSIEHDRKYRIPLIKKAFAAAGGHLRLFASPWSPPGFMKSNNEMLHGGTLLPEYYTAWARYFTKFIKAYEDRGVPVWGITIQNEPMATQRWESCIFSANEERDFLKKFLGPIMNKNGLGNKKIIIWDHNRDLINHRVNTILEDPEAAQYVWGIGFHWYEAWTGSEPMFINLGAINEAFPGKKLIFTEGCADSFDPARYQHWPNAERYGRSMINDFNQGTVAWTDWNILLNENGGPNHVQNFCFAPIHGNSKSGELIYTPSYYYIGHFSKFIRPGARRISTSCSRSHLLSTTFQNVDGSYATVVMNHTGEKIEYKMLVGDSQVTMSIPAHAIQTLIY